ncbi:MAG: hypothetical protein JKY48_18500 [Flavobacteriales bacterium]|nr:hypothetical protein [Flavobacteriales bacterium]
MKYLFPIILKRFINKQQEKFNQQQYSSNDSSSNEFKKDQVSPKKEKLGDYVDYEEVD